MGGWLYRPLFYKDEFGTQERLNMANVQVSPFRRAANGIYQRRYKLFLLILVIGFGCFLATLISSVLNALYTGAAWTQIDIDFDLSNLTAIPIILIAFIVELHLVGWDRSSIKKVLECGTNTSRQDIFFTVLFLTNLLTLFGHIASLGMGYMLHAYIQEQFSASLFGDMGILGGVIFMWFVGPLLFYFFHLLQHTRFFWEFHKVHHAAKEMELINNFRDHPVVMSFRAALDYLPFIIFGVDPIAIFIYRGTSGVITLWQHSNYYEPFPWVEKYLFIGARGHSMHHSTNEKHYMTNMGFVVFWDWLFGTLNKNYDKEITIGLSEEPNFNTSTPAKEIFTTYFLGLKSFSREVVATFR
jgi:sterol desaturase/sphingolipid hydroxylase (fatty acid hydroxylase superfamily)